MNRAIFEHVIALVEQQGTDCWWDLSTEELLPPSERHRGKHIFSCQLLSTLVLLMRVLAHLGRSC